ncbi:MAG: damage-control phosphatase ARMT1 family protein [Candidatus Hermodarchaeia archaeon]
MQIHSRCVSCLISRGFQEVLLSTSDLDLQLAAITEVVGILYNSLTKGGRLEKIPAYVGTLRDQAIQRITGCSDPYASWKQESNETALKLVPSLERFVDKEKNPKQRFRRACLAASLGNIIEYGVAGHEIPWENLTTLISQTEAELAIDHIPTFYQLAQKANTILYLTDNAGEVVFDRLLVKALTEMGSKVVVAVKGAPVLNDAMLADAKVAGLMDFAEIISTGGGAVGVLPQWCSKEFLNRFTEVDLVIAKGMGHHETLPEFTLPTPTAHLLRTKCEPVAHSLNVVKDRNIVNVLVNHQGPLGPLVKN